MHIRTIKRSRKSEKKIVFLFRQYIQRNLLAYFLIPYVTMQSAH